MEERQIYIETALSPFSIELIHFIGPALQYLDTSDVNLLELVDQNKVKEQIEWITQCNVDSILPLAKLHCDTIGRLTLNISSKLS